MTSLNFEFSGVIIVVVANTLRLVVIPAAPCPSTARYSSRSPMTLPATSTVWRTCKIYKLAVVARD
jgi:hypothetical protein